MTRPGRKGEKVEVDSTIARIIGSDWGDRRNQPVSFAMRVYWVIFGVVLLNGAYTYFTGKDESYLVEKLQQKVDEKRGKVETSEYVKMADSKREDSSNSTQSVGTTVTAPKVMALTDASTAQPVENGAPVSMISRSPLPPPMMTFGRRRLSQQPRSKTELVAELEQLRARQSRLRDEMRGITDMRSSDDIKRQIASIDVKKADLKKQIKEMA